MRSGLFALLTALGALAGWWAIPDKDPSLAGGAIPERWVNANLVQIQVDGEWIDVPLMPLTERACRAPQFEKYCE